MKKIKQAFTLVELIVVITILAILATVGFVSFSWYLAWARDTNRIAQLKSMSDALELYRTKKDLPIPDDKVDIQVNGTTIAYQWYIWANVLETIEYTEKGLDPKDKTYFTYYLTKNKKYYQLLTFLEEPSEDTLLSSLNYVKALDYSSRYPYVKWNKLWILTNSENTPIQDIAEVQSNGYLDTNNVLALELRSFLAEKNYVEWTGASISNELLKLSAINKAGWKYWNVDNNAFVFKDTSIVSPTVFCLDKSPWETFIQDWITYTVVEAWGWTNGIRTNLALIDPEWAWTNLCTSLITDMSWMFAYASSFNWDISTWDTSNVTNMLAMFSYASSFNWDISAWDTSNVSTMETLFTWATSFNWDISAWDTSNVSTMGNIFYWATSFNWDLSLWDTSNVISMQTLFYWATSFNWDISLWNTSSVTDMWALFYWATSFNWDISLWNTSSVTNMASLFQGASVFNQEYFSMECW